MKRSCSHADIKTSRRRGALFHYYLAYLTLVSSVFLMAGTCLHTILKSDQTDRRVSMFLHSLLRCERILRADSEESTPTIESDSAMTFAQADGVKIHWSADRGILTRIEKRGDETLKSDRFLFPAGSKIQIQSRDDGATVFRFLEPSIFVKYSAVGSGALNRHKPIDEALPTTPAAAAVQPVTEIILR
jgi:hypothetical protein